MQVYLGANECCYFAQPCQNSRQRLLGKLVAIVRIAREQASVASEAFRILLEQ